MPKLPTVAIIGRPNTGKSTLFNRLIGSRRAIVTDVPGTTRDLLSQRIDGDKVSYLLLDTGGIGATRDKDFEKDVAGQSLLAIENADLILFTVNGKEPITKDDLTVVSILRKKRKRHVPVIVLITKADTPGMEDSIIADFNEVNIGEHMIAISAPHLIGVDELSEAIEEELGKLHFETLLNDEETVPIPRIAIVGRPNVGKSSIVNALMAPSLKEINPILVSPIAGTTRDSIDTLVRYHDQPYMLVDTAGLRKRARANVDEVERYSVMRTLSAVEGSDVVVLVIDASVMVTQQDKKIAALASESGKGLIIIVNKIDLLKGEARSQRLEDVAKLLHFCRFAKFLPCSAVTGEGLTKLFDVVEAVQLSRVRRISTRELQRWFEQTIHGEPIGQLSTCKHLTQAKDIPPTFVLFVRDPRRISVSQLRFLENRFRETFGFDGTPIRWIMKSSKRAEGENNLRGL